MGELITLRYFPIVGRAQPIRHALADAGVAFEDLRLSGAEWDARREDPAFGGTFALLPTLTWGVDTVSETLAIAGFLARRLGHHTGLDDVTIARIEAISSHCYLEVLLRLNELMWAERLYPGVDLPNAFARHLAHMVNQLSRLEAHAPATTWLVTARPTFADFFAAEAFEAVRHVLGREREAALGARLPRLRALADAVRTRPTLARCWEARPPQLTAALDEQELLDRLRGL